MTDPTAGNISVEALAEEFLARKRKGERPTVAEYLARYPHLADEIRDVFPVLGLVEDFKPSPGEATGSFAEAEIPGHEPRETRLGDFRLLRVIGRGGMGVVYEAEQVSLGRHVALKVLPNQALKDVKQKRRFEREARAAARLHHTNIVPVFGVGEHDGSPYYAMQYIQGLGLDAVLSELNRIKPAGASTGTGSGVETDLTSRGASAAEMAQSLLTGVFPRSSDATAVEGHSAAALRAFDPTEAAEQLDGLDGEHGTLATSPRVIGTADSSRLSDSFDLAASSLSLQGSSSADSGRKSAARKPTYWQTVANIGRQVASALEYAHQQGILHRDIKPSNLLLDLRGAVWVTDFGLAKVAGPGVDDLTRTGDIVGTLRYMPPEAFEGQSDARSDVYALGLTLYELLTLKPAFAEKDRNKLIKQVTTLEPLRLDQVRREIPRDLVTIVHKAIEKEPSRRYATANELAADLDRFIDDEPILARRQTQLERYVRWARHNPWIARLSAALAAVLIVVTIGAVVVAGHMSRLAGEAAEKAAGERDERAKAVLAQQAAERSSAEARAAEEQGRKLLYATDMQLAPFVWKDDRSTANQLRGLLAKHVPEPSSLPAKPDLRSFEWYYYRHLVDHSARVLSGHNATIVGGAFRSDGRLVTLDRNGQLRRFDLTLQVEDEAGRRDLPGFAGNSAVTLSPDGRLAALAAGNQVRLFDTSTGQETGHIESADVQFRDLIFARDSARLVIVDDKIRVCDAVTHELIASVGTRFDRLASLAVSADGLTLAVVGHGPTGAELSTFRLDAAARTLAPLARGVTGFSGGSLGACALSPDGQRLAFGTGLIGSVTVCDSATGRWIADNSSAHAPPVRAMAFSADGARLATADDQGTIKIWASAAEPNSKSEDLLTLKGHHGMITAVGFASDGKWLFTTSADKTARVWDLESAGADIRQLEGHATGQCRAARFSPDGQLIAAATGTYVRLWDAATGRFVRQLSTGGQGYVSSVAFSPGDKRLLAVGYSGQTADRYVSLWDIDTATERARLPVATDSSGFDADPDLGSAGALAFSPDGKYLVAGFGLKRKLDDEAVPNPLTVWEIATRRPIHRLDGHNDYALAVDFSRDGTLLATGSHDGTVIIWSTATWKSKATLRCPEKTSFSQTGQDMVTDVAFAPDSQTLAVSSLAGNVQLWDVGTGKLPEALKGHSGAVLSLAFSPDGRTLASGSTDQTVRLWNVETRRELMRLDSNNVTLHEVWSLAFSADGTRLIAGGGHSTAFWSAAPSLWNDPDQAALRLRDLLRSNADFQSRIRMFSENLRLHEAVAKLDGSDPCVQAALAATEANWHAARQAWPKAARAFDRLVTADQVEPDAWLRTPGLFRVATALFHENRPGEAAKLLHGVWKRVRQDGFPAVSRDEVTGHQFIPLREALEQRLVQNPRERGLLELRATLSGMELVPLLAKISAADPTDTMLSLKLAALQAWFGRQQELDATRKRILAVAQGTGEASTAERAATACSLLPATDQDELDRALALGRIAAKLNPKRIWSRLVHGMVEYRSGNLAAADEILLAVAKVSPNTHRSHTATFYRAMSLFRQGKKDEARELAAAAAAQIEPLPVELRNPLSAGPGLDDLILWLAYKEAKAMIQW